MTQTNVLNAKTNKILKSAPFSPIMGSVVDDNVGCGTIDLASAKFGLHLVVNNKARYDSVESLRADITGGIILNANVLDALLVNPHLIPDAWQGQERVYFWGTTYKHSHMPRYVRFLHWVDGKATASLDYLFLPLNRENHAAAVLVSST